MHHRSAEKVNESTQLNKGVSTSEMLAIPVILALKSGIILFVIPKIPYDNCSLTRDQSAVTAPFVTSAAQTLCSGNSEMSARSPLSLSATTTELFREYSSNSRPTRHRQPVTKATDVLFTQSVKSLFHFNIFTRVIDEQLPAVIL